MWSKLMSDRISQLESITNLLTHHEDYPHSQVTALVEMAKEVSRVIYSYHQNVLADDNAQN